MKLLLRHLSAITSAIAVSLPWCVNKAATQTPEIVLSTPQGRSVTVTALTDNIIRVTNAANGETIPQSKACVIASPQSDATIKEITPGVTALSTPTGIIVTTDAATGYVTINAGQGKLISDEGLRLKADGKQTLTLSTTSGGSYYGAGERGHKLNLRGDTLVMYNRQNYGYTKGDTRINQMNITMPLFISSDGFAVVFDDFGAASLFLSEGQEITYTTESSTPVSYYFVNGAKTIADVTTSLTSLTGRQPLPPLWSLGYITSKYGYHNEKETLGAIDTLKNQGYPVDGIVLDLYWYGKEQDMGRLAWDPKQWPNPKKMLKKLKDDNVNLVAISQPYILRNGKGIDNYKYLSSNGLLLADSTGTAPQEVKIWVGEGGMFDVSNPDTRAWLANRYKQLTDMGISGWWGDLGEPEVHPESGMHANGLTARQYHNQYGNDWSEIISELFTKEYPDRRLLTMMRGGTTGLQRYSVFPWSTDVSRSWGGLQPQITIMLNSGLSGLGYMGHDVGGFAVDPENPIDPELYVRWLQLGLFSPMLRTHAQSDAEPYHYPQYADITKAIIKERYRWLPYNYTLAYDNAVYGYPLVRPLNFHEAGSNAYDAIDDEFLWGSEVLVAPVLTPGATERKVVFPQGKWIDYNDPLKAYDGGTEITYKAPLDVIPLFVKAGSFLPKVVYGLQSTADYDPAYITVDYYPLKGIDSKYVLYDDNRLSPTSLADGEYRLVTFEGKVDDKGNIAINISSQGSYPGAPQRLHFKFRVHGVSTKYKEMSIRNGDLIQNSNLNDNTLVFDVEFTPDQKPNVQVDY